MTPVRLEPAALRSRVKHSTTEPLRSHKLFLCFDQALHQANRLENLVQLFNAESHAIGIKPVHGICDAIAKYAFDKIVKEMDMSLIILTQNGTYNFHALYCFA